VEKGIEWYEEHLEIAGTTAHSVSELRYYWRIALLLNDCMNGDLNDWNMYPSKHVAKASTEGYQRLVGLRLRRMEDEGRQRPQ
jgi:hypothetical protein